LGKLGKILLLLVLLGAGAYFLDQQGIIDLSGNIEVNIGGHVWNNSDFSDVALNPQDHAGEKASLDVYVFNKLDVNTSSGSKTLYEAYLGNKTSLQQNPYDLGKRITFSLDSGDIPVDSCYHINGKVSGQASITTLEGKTINPVYLKVQDVEPIACPSGPTQQRG
jgi:hypothetical protein